MESIWRVMPVAQKKHDQPIWDVQTKLSKNAFLENKKTKKANESENI